MYIFLYFLYIYMPNPIPATTNSQLSGMIANTIDNESIVIIAPEANSTETTSSFNTRLENTTVKYLASGNSHEQITKTPPANLTVTEISKTDREQFDIETTSDISNVSFALISQYDSSVQPTPDYNTYDIGTVEQSSDMSVSIIKPTSSIYDSNIQFNYTSNSGPFYSTSDNDGETFYPSDINGTIENKGTWRASFDETNTNVNYSKSINSEYNANYERPMRISELSTFNKKYSLGMDLLSEPNIQNYFTLDSNTGEPIVNPISNTGGQSSYGDISESYRLYDNGFYAVKTEDFTNISSEHYGSYRLQQNPDAALITISEGEKVNFSINQSNVANFPIFNANNNSTLPVNVITIDQLYSAFDVDVENIVPGYKYTATITEQTNSGYSPSQDMSLRTDTSNTFTLDDTSLLNNSSYMKHYVNGTHTLSFEPATLTIESDETESDSNLDLFELNEERETLSDTVFNNGQIKINNNSPTTRYVTDNTSTLSITPNVFYNSEDTKVGISDELKTNYSVTYLTQLVAKNTKDINGSFMKNGNVALDLYNGESICNSFFNTNNFEFTATNSNTSNDAEVYRITPSKQLSSINNFSSVAINGTSTPVNFVSAFATVQNLATLVSTNNVFNTAKMLFNLRNLTDSSIYSNVINKGWNLTIPSQYNGKMVSSSLNAFASNNICFPSLEETQKLINGIITKIDYNISVNTDASGDSSNISDGSQLSDYVEIKWSSDNFVNNTNSMIISEEMMTKNQVNATTTLVEVSNNITVSGKLTGQNIKVYRVLSTRQINYTFELPLRPFLGLTMTTPNISVNTTYYKVKNIITDEYYPSSYLQYISDNLSTNYSSVSETFSQVLPVTGSLNSTDLCDMFVKVQGKDINSNNIIDLTNQYLVTAMYGIEITMELKSIAEQVADKNGDIKLSIEVEYLSSTGEEGDVLYDNVDYGYMLQLTNSYETNYTVDYWSSNVSNITSKTNIACLSNTTDYSNKSLTISDGFSNISQWNTTDYIVKVTHEETDQSTSVLSIYKTGSTASLYEIRTKNFTFLNTQAFISNISKDIYRNDRWIGQNQISSTITFSEKFMIVDYTYTNDSVNQTNVFSIDTGIYLTKSGLSSTTFKQLSDIGKYIKFSLKGDSIGVNMTGEVASLNENIYISEDDTITIPNHTITNNGFSFQYINDDEESRILTIPYYRGFYGASQNSGIQVYTIQRDTMVATLSIPRTTEDTTFPATISQSFNVYYNKEYSVDNLSGCNVGSIGLKIKFLMSMLKPSDTNSFTIYTMGDNVSFTIVNPNADATEEETSYRIAPETTTLKTFVLDTFTGSNYNGTSSPLSLNSYRLKINTNNISNLFANTTASWSIELASRTIVLYKNDCYLGNPENLDINDPYSSPDDSKWVIVNTDKLYYFDDVINTGIPIGPWTIFKNTTYSLPNISFFVIAPPFLKFMKVISNTKTLPYEFDESDLKISYLPVAETVDGIQTYNPFTASTTYDYIATTNCVSSVTVKFDQTIANDVTFVQTSPEELVSSYSSSLRDVATQYFVVEGALLKLSLFVGLKSQNGFEVATLFADENDDALPANRLMYCNDDTSYFYMDSLNDSNSGIQMKLLQPLNTNTPYPNLSMNQVYSSNATKNANVTINIDNFFILPSHSLSCSTENSFNLDLPAGQGTKVCMITHELLSNTDGSIDIIVYKYKAINNVDYSNVNNDGSSDGSLQSIALTFLEREYKMVSISSADYTASFRTIGIKPNQSFDTFIANQASKFESLPWTLDTNWPNANMPDTPSVYVNVSQYTQAAQQTIPAKVFATRTDGKAKALLAWKYPIFTVLDKLGRKTFQISGSGSITTSSVATSRVSLNNYKNEATSGNFSNILKSSQVGWPIAGFSKPSPPTHP